ncbi:thiamine pyrophosphate enzyme, N-terminal TPP binding domain-containing protein [Cokeromyces recurvatus]|uniref:thiamine pyrophosphate enzyme, N-terminal TPP binding domain-containing protein n=1 Tax=Cokeromyces recurvatus TaxID=90255 RepID=UPI0022204E77|nr:thiamine pyrophosphate enzyme, N-terminal TPP binding domain-containing protein [Cokeromyces recurvatus]KAI7903227.1 thiamine pyrophosphate enzyme, N-terminal TPP binding domain-containing protein [Cokeromyces recurvatus]
MSESDVVIASGAELIARTLKSQGVEVVFGIVGIPIVEVAEACVAAGIRFIGFRNEQSAAYAASVYGYLSGYPGVCLTVGGPGVIHALAGVLNSKLNCWPLILLSGSCESDQVDKGAFQELDQVEATRPYCKYSARSTSIEQLPSTIEKAFRAALYGRPGPAYVDLPADYVQYPIRNKELYDSIQLPRIPNAPKSMASQLDIDNAISLLKNAQHPLIVVGKGAAYARAENEVREFIDKVQVPFLPTPMGKGVVRDDHPLCVSAARSKVLKEADVVLLIGARLNWILHYGQSPRWNKDVKFIQIDIAPEELGNNCHDTLHLLGDIQLVVPQLTRALDGKLPNIESTYVSGLLDKVKQNVEKLKAAGANGSDDAVLTYQAAFTVIKNCLPEDDIVYVSEGANTMDIARSYFDVNHPRQRLDAGTGATMGVGMGYTIGAQVYYSAQENKKRVVSIVGDSAFGFSAMEIETAIRSCLPVVIIVINNNGIYHGLEDDDYQTSQKEGTLPTTALSPEVRYDLISEACGGKGWLVKNRVELAKALEEALASKDQTCLINVLIAPGGRQKLDFAWMQKSKKSRL